MGVIAVVLLVGLGGWLAARVQDDGLHNWWELHPLIGWARGHITAPAAGGLDD